MESTFQKIIRKTGKKPSECKCQQCQKQCRTCVCLGTPEDMQKLIDAGYSDRLILTAWAAGKVMGITTEVIPMVSPLYDNCKGACTFFKNGLCELHIKGLKPTEGRLSNHVATISNFDPKKSIAWAVAKEWWTMTETEVENMLKPACHV